MLRTTTLAAVLTLCPVAAMQAESPALSFEMETLDGQAVDLAQKYAGKVVLLVNVASRCGYTRQYEGLQELHDRYADQGLAIVGVPCNQFGGQEPGTADEIASFCSSTYGVEFDMLGKVEVNGDGQCPLYAYLTGESSPYPGKIRWNFEKFLVGKDGELAGRYPSRVEPTGPELIADIERALAAE